MTCTSELKMNHGTLMADYSRQQQQQQQQSSKK